MRLIFTLLFIPLFFQGFSKTLIDTAKRNAKKELHFPDPANVSKLFYIQRDPNINTLIYELNMAKNGELDEETPVHICLAAI